MKYGLLAAIFLSALPAFAGGSIGGGGAGITRPDLTQPLLIEAENVSTVSIPDLGLTTIDVSPEVYRRARLRLSAGLPETKVITPSGDTLAVKSRYGAILDLSETAQIVTQSPK